MKFFKFKIFLLKYFKKFCKNFFKFKNNTFIFFKIKILNPFTQPPALCYAENEIIPFFH